MPYVYLQQGCTFGKSNIGEEFLTTKEKNFLRKIEQKVTIRYYYNNIKVEGSTV